jgi:HAD superfamily phosphatase (TIGR01668 family)
MIAMALLRPGHVFHRVWEIDGSFLRGLGVKALFLDVDNTLTTPDNPIPDSAALEWLDRMKAEGIALVLVSNNSARRVSGFAKTLGVGFSSRACKPLPIGFIRAAGRLGLRPGQTAVVGDQIFTDIIGGNIIGAVTVLVEPMVMETGALFRFKRIVEKKVLTRYRKE